MQKIPNNTLPTVVAEHYVFAVFLPLFVHNGRWDGRIFFVISIYCRRAATTFDRGALIRARLPCHLLSVPPPALAGWLSAEPWP